jgi:hypothetical protein
VVPWLAPRAPSLPLFSQHRTGDRVLRLWAFDLDVGSGPLILIFQYRGGDRVLRPRVGPPVRQRWVYIWGVHIGFSWVLPALGQVHEFVECSNVRKAAKKVGISLGRAQRILRDRLVDDYFHSIVDELRDISILNRSFLEQEYLMTLAQLNGDEEVPKMNRDGDMVWGKHFDGSAKVSLLKDMRGFIGIKDSSSDTKTVVQINFGAAGYREEHDPSVVIEGEVVGGD